MRGQIGSLWELLQETGVKWVEDDAPRLGAALAYYAVFSLGPLLVILVAIAGLLFGHDAVRGELSGQLDRLLGHTGAQAVETMLAGAAKPHEGFIASLVGLVILVFGAIGVVSALKDALNAIWRVKPSRRRKGVWPFVRTYVISLAGVLALGFLLVVSLAVTTVTNAAGNALLPDSDAFLLESVNFVLSFAIITLLFATMFKWLPDADIAWRDVWPGALVTAALFNLGKFLIGLYLGRQALESTYGAAAALMVILIWTYYSAQIVFLGAAFTEVYARRFGTKARGKRAAASNTAKVPHTRSTRANSG